LATNFTDTTPYRTSHTALRENVFVSFDAYEVIIIFLFILR